jgi:4-amino-4-deoxy-L-arabinose transferase-like glycosyltransferase
MFRSKARIAAAAILFLGWCATLALSWPGHLSYDSIVQLHDGRAGFYHSWHPPVMAWMLGLGDWLLHGTGLFVLFDATLLFAALASLIWLAPRTSWLGVCIAALCVALPQLVLYQMIVWKDVLFADAAVAGFICLAQAEAHWAQARTRFILIVAAFILFALAALARQNGVIVVLFGAIALGIAAWRARGWKIGVLYAGTSLASTVVLALLVAFALSLRSDHGEGPVAQLKLLRLYDIIGAVKADPSLPLDRFDEDASDLERLIRTDGVKLYTPVRNDTLVGSQALQDELADTPPELMAAQWSDLVFHHPWLYLKVRAEVFRWVFFTPDIVACRPIFVGVEGPPGEMSDLGLVTRLSPRDQALSDYAKAFLNTPVFSHIAFAILGLVLTVVLLWRRRPGDTAIAFLLLSAFAFTASFFAISIACDYRYLYMLDLAVLAALLYVALDPAHAFQVPAMWSGSFWLARSDARKS